MSEEGKLLVKGKGKKGKVVTLDAGEKPKKAPAKRGKKQMTKEEAKELLTKAIAEFDQIIQDIKDEKLKIAPLGLKRLPELVDETIKNLEEDVNDMREDLEDMDIEAVESSQ